MIASNATEWISNRQYISSRHTRYTYQASNAIYVSTSHPIQNQPKTASNEFKIQNFHLIQHEKRSKSRENEAYICMVQSKNLNLNAETRRWLFFYSVWDSHHFLFLFIFLSVSSITKCNIHKKCVSALRTPYKHIRLMNSKWMPNWEIISILSKYDIAIVLSVSLSDYKATNFIFLTMKQTTQYKNRTVIWMRQLWFDIIDSIYCLVFSLLCCCASCMCVIKH